jgi:hypothetical protein
MRLLKISTGVCTILALLHLLPGLVTRPLQGASGSRNHALIIGIGNYDQWPELKSPPLDAQALARTLRQKYNFRGKDIVLLTDKTKEKPTLVNILSTLDNLTETLGENDNLLVFYSGHSAEDDDGDTYWIPQDGKKKTKLTWLRHSDIVEEYFGSESFKANSLCIITDSMFSSGLTQRRAISLTPYDLRYEEKIIEKGRQRSREVIAFGDQHWPGSKKTGGLGLFSFYLVKALTENTLEVIDFENLIFDENILFPISKIAGTKLRRGRLKTDMDAGGQFVIAKTQPLPVIDVLTAEARPEKGYPGDPFEIAVKTSAKADSVVLEMDGRRIALKGGDTEWRYKARFDKIGTSDFTITALNPDEVAGQTAKGRLTVIEKKAQVASVTDATVSPPRGVSGDTFTFEAATDLPAKSVQVVVDGRKIPMQGSGTNWSLSHKIDATGQVDYRIVAINADGVSGAAGSGKIALEAPPVNVVAVSPSPESGYAGETFSIAVKTDRPAAGVTLQIGEKRLEMVGKNREWRLQYKVMAVGQTPFSAVARNATGKTGKSGRGMLVAKRTPLAIPDVVAVAVTPQQGYAGDEYEITATTSVPADTVVVDIDGRQYPMTGDGSQWRYSGRIERVGSWIVGVSARNEDGARGQPGSGRIIALKVPAQPVNVLLAEVNPVKGYKGKPFTFRAETDKPATRVELVLGKRTYPMQGAGTRWELSQLVASSGKLDFTVVARNEDDQPGETKTAVVGVYSRRFKRNADGSVTDRLTGKKRERFIDNADGTITDLYTSLMWLKSPKRIAVSYASAQSYCSDLAVNELGGWRLPTISEWKRLADPKARKPALPRNYPFKNVLSHIDYWSKSKHKFGPQYVYGMSLKDGKPGYLKKSDNAIVWPVRYTELSDLEG